MYLVWMIGCLIWRCIFLSVLGDECVFYMLELLDSFLLGVLKGLGEKKVYNVRIDFRDDGY